MGLDLIGYKEVEGHDWSMSYYTFDSLRAVHDHAVMAELRKNKKYLDKVANDLFCIDLDEVQTAFYNHSDCEGVWDSLQTPAICKYLKYTREVFIKYAKKNYPNLDLVDAYDGLIDLLENCDMVEFC